MDRRANFIRRGARRGHGDNLPANDQLRSITDLVPVRPRDRRRVLDTSDRSLLLCAGLYTASIQPDAPL